MREIVLTRADAAQKLENFLKKQYPIGYVRKLFRKSGVRLNGHRAKPQVLVRSGDRIQLYIPFEPSPALRPLQQAAPNIDIVFQDPSLLVINKPAGVAVHEGKTVGKQASVLGILERLCGPSGVKPMLVHRLDKDTSGLLLVAKTPQAADELKACFETHKVGKEYLCLVCGRLPMDEGKIDFPLPGREGNLVRALSHYRVLKRFSATTLVRVTTETGRLHQIRLHLAKLGYPVVMDDQHGDFTYNKRFRKEFGLKRQFLHAEKIKLIFSGRRREWTAPLAKDLVKTLRLLSEKYPQT
jgi:23S rRNA pseudouridine955/2504/2580 synthase